MNTYTYDTTTFADLATILTTHCVPDYFDSVSVDQVTGDIECVVGNVTVLSFSYDNSYFTTNAIVTGKTTTAISRAVGSGDKLVHTVHTTDNAVLLTASSTTAVTYYIIITKNQDNDLMFINATTSGYYAWTNGDYDVPSSISTISDSTRTMVELVPYVTNAGENAVSYSENVFWLPVSVAYTATGNINYGFVKAIDGDDVQYYYNGVTAIK